MTNIEPLLEGGINAVSNWNDHSAATTEKWRLIKHVQSSSLGNRAACCVFASRSNAMYRVAIRWWQVFWQQ